MSAIGFVRKALAMGVDLETALKMGEAFEAEMPVFVPPVETASDAAMEKRRAYDRQRQAEKRAALKAASTGHPPTSADSAIVQGHPQDKAQAKDAPAPVHTRGENNLSRLVDTGLGVGVVGALKPDQQTDDWPTGSADAIAKLLVRTVASAWLDPHKSPDLVTTAGRIAAWKRAGASWEFDVLPVVTGLCANRRSAVSSWKFFDAAMGRSIADNRRALEIPEAAPRMAARDPPRSSFADQLGDERRRATEMTLKALSVANG